MFVVQRREGELLTIAEATQIKVLKIGWRTVRLMVAAAAELPAAQGARERIPRNPPDRETCDDDSFYVFPIGF